MVHGGLDLDDAGRWITMGTLESNGCQIPLKRDQLIVDRVVPHILPWFGLRHLQPLMMALHMSQMFGASRSDHVLQRFFAVHDLIGSRDVPTF